MNFFSNQQSFPVIANIDTDPYPEFILVNNRNSGMMFAFDNDFEIMWQRKIQDESGQTSPAIYDLNGDQIPEIIHRDEMHIRIINSLDGVTVDSCDCISSTGSEMPVIVDYNLDGQTDILVTCGDSITDTKGKLYNLFVASSLDLPAARPVWNQLNYFNTNVEDNLSIPQFQQSADQVPDLNNFLVQAGKYQILDISLENLFFDDCGILNIEICNLGQMYLSDSLYFSIYSNDNFELLNTYYETINLESNNCHKINIHIDENEENYLIVLNDLGSDDPLEPNTYFYECDITNNLDSITVKPSDTANERIIDTLMHCDSIILFGPDHMVAYEWSTTENSMTIVARNSGTYSLEVLDSCGRTISESIELFVHSCVKESLYIPNAFSPNNDGINDLFKIFTNQNFGQASLSIYSRWGSKIYSQNGLVEDLTWNGTSNNIELNQGIYIYVLRYNNNGLNRIKTRDNYLNEVNPSIYHSLLRSGT